MLKRNQERRKRQLIDRRQQLKFAVTLAFYALMYPIIFFFLATVPPFSTTLTDPARVEPLIRQFIGFNLAHWWIGVLSLVIILGLSLIFSHKIFGPMSRCEALLRERLDSRPEQTPMRLRRGDYFQGFVDILERALSPTTALARNSLDVDPRERPMG